MFDPNTFLQETVIDEELSTELPLIPVNEYPAIITKLDAREQPKRDDPAVLFHILDITYEIEDQSAREATGMDHPSIRDSIFLDLDENGKLKTGKTDNVQLGRLLANLGIPAVGFTFGKLVGHACKVRVKHDPDKNDPTRVWARVAGVGTL